MIVRNIEDGFANAVWDALKGDHNDLRKQQIILKAYRESALAHACVNYDDAIDMMFDGPDESDEDYAKARWRDARRYVCAAQGIEAATAGETACGLDGNGDAPNPTHTTTGG